MTGKYLLLAFLAACVSSKSSAVEIVPASRHEYWSSACQGVQVQWHSKEAACDAAWKYLNGLPAYKTCSGHLVDDGITNTTGSFFCSFPTWNNCQSAYVVNPNSGCSGEIRWFCPRHARLWDAYTSESDPGGYKRCRCDDGYAAKNKACVAKPSR